jgi:metallo-beta-lactamase family protein
MFLIITIRSKKSLVVTLLAMKLTCFGASRTVTGSRFMLENREGKRILLDAGLFQGRGKTQKELNQHPKFDPGAIDAVVLTHAHIDHSGYLPYLYKHGFRGPVYCTEATADLCEIMLPDSGHIQEEDVRFINKHRRRENKKLLEPLYTIEDAEAILDQLRPISTGKEYDVMGFGCSLYGTGHLLGSVGIRISSHSKSLFYTGDIGRLAPRMLKPPVQIPSSDYIMCESTYGDKIHDEEVRGLELLLNEVRRTCVEQGGKLLIPAFSIGRTQEIIFALDFLHTFEMLPDIPVYVDSPLSTKGTGIYRKHLNQFNETIQRYLETDADPFCFPNLHFIQSVEESKSLNAIKGPCIIISSSGMMEAGRIRHHIRNHIQEPESTLLITSHTEPGTLGGRLRKRPETVRLFGEDLPVKFRIEEIPGLSAHADQEELMAYLKPGLAAKPAALFLVHGSLESSMALKEMVNNNFPETMVVIPKFGENFML